MRSVDHGHAAGRRLIASIAELFVIAAIVAMLLVLWG
jgi:hypothetical protein